MAETLGSLIDKLTIANIRLWHLEDVRRDRNLPDKDRLAAADAISEVNKQRNDLIDEIDEFLYKAAHGQVKLKAPKVKMYKKFQLTPDDDARAEELARSSDAAARARKKTTKSSKSKKTAKKTAKKSGGKKK